jgi:Domain of unknown function (DUF4149)
MSARALTDAAGTLLLCAWLGAALVVAVVVAPAAFAVLPSRSLAGALVGRVLPAIFWSGMAIGLVTAVLAWSLPHRAWSAGGAVVLALACGVAQLGVAPRIERIRASIDGAVDALDPADPRRQAFGRLHGMSVAWLALGGVAAGVVLVVLVRDLVFRRFP